MMFKRRFPNGFKSWQVTHYHVVQYITAFLASPDPDGILIRIFHEHGQQSLYMLAIEWSRDYEEINRNRKIEPELKKREIRNFCELKNFPFTTPENHDQNSTPTAS